MSHALVGPPQRAARLCALILIAAAALLASSVLPQTAAAGPYKVSWSEPSDLRNHVVYRPTNAPASAKLPVLVWGEGGCFANGLVYQGFLTEIASHGVVVLASGGPYGVGTTTVGFMSRSVDWAKAQNAKAGGVLQGRLLPKVAVAGHSCGGLEAYQLAAARPADVGAVGILNSGQLQVDQAQLDAQTAPVLFLLGGSGDVAYANGLRDFGRLPAALPRFLGTINTGHFGTYFNPAGGSYATYLKDWIFYALTGDANAGKSFVGASCRICTAAGWKVQQKNLG